MEETQETQGQAKPTDLAVTLMWLKGCCVLLLLQDSHHLHQPQPSSPLSLLQSLSVIDLHPSVDHCGVLGGGDLERHMCVLVLDGGGGVVSE